MQEYWHFLRLIKQELPAAIFGIFMSFVASFSSVALMGTATWFLSAMAVAGFYDVVLNIFIPSALIRLLALSRTLLRYGERYYTHDATFKILAHLKVFLFQRALDLNIEDAIILKSSDLQRRMQADLERLEIIYVRQCVPVICAFFMGLSLGGLLLAYSWLMALCALSLMVLAGVVVPIILTKLCAQESKNLSILATAMHDKINTLIHGFFDLMLLGSHGKEAKDFLELSKGLAKSRSVIVFSDQLSQVVLMACAEITLVVLLLIGIPLVEQGQFSGSVLMMLAVVAMATFEVVVPLSAACLNLPHVLHSAHRVSELLKITQANALLDPMQGQSYAKKLNQDLDEQEIEKLNSLSKKIQLSEAYQQALAFKQKQGYTKIELNHVSFAYASLKNSKAVIENCSLTFDSRLNYVIQAPSGRGKSTLCLLLTGLLHAQSGTISLNGQAYQNLKLNEICNHFAVALQDITLFSGSILDVFKQVRANITVPEIMEALKLVELDELISALPHGLDEWVGNTGLTISGGQARRLCLARALVIKDSDFLILDEPGEGLDLEQERRILERIENMRKGVIIITHKQAGLSLADQVIHF